MPGASGRADAAPAFRELRAGRLRLWVAADLEPLARRLGLDAPDAFEHAFADARGPGGRAPTALLVTGDAAPLLLRRLRHGGALGPLLGGLFLGARRPRAELRVNAVLRDAGAPVPRPAFALAHRRFGPLFECAVGTVFEEGCVDALAFLQSDPTRPRLLRAAAAAGRAVRRFHDAGGRHADLQLRNLLIRESATETACLVIDLDRARCEAAVPPSARMAELMRLYRSLRKRARLDQVGARGCARFFGAYCAGERPLRAALRARLPREQRRLALHAWRYGV